LKESQYPQFFEPLTPDGAATERCPVSRQDAVQRILIMRTGAFGDVLMGTPLLKALRQAYPNAHLTWMIEPKYKECMDANPYIDEVIAWNGGYWKQLLRMGNLIGWIFLALRFLRQLRQRRYDVFISFQPEEYGLLQYAVGAAINIGVFDTFRRFNLEAETSKNTQRYQYAYTHRDLPAHRTDQYLLALRALDLPRTEEKQMVLNYTAQDRDAVTKFLKDAQITPVVPYVVLAPTTTWETRNWPVERYVEVGDALAERGYRVILVGNRRNKKRDQATLDIVLDVEMRLAIPPTMAMDLLSFRELAALIDGAALVVSGDTGPMHMAAALETHYVASFGPTSPHWYAPLTGRGLSLAHKVPCGPCDRPHCANSPEEYLCCQRLVTTQEVLQAADSLLASQEAILI
jgi:ADP-heptose:LPS heptosyltransferase